ncbi:hypothetical protein MPLA_140038 [Mesorhizobium sp. ORS 3359]|nr:hypothetical protein MPLA_140038 [Mesorhizobium sp. ORS 3359]
MSRGRRWPWCRTTKPGARRRSPARPGAVSPAEAEVAQGVQIYQSAKIIEERLPHILDHKNARHSILILDVRKIISKHAITLM